MYKLLNDVRRINTWDGVEVDRTDVKDERDFIQEERYRKSGSWGCLP